MSRKRLLPVFRDPPGELDPDWNHGVLLVGIDQFNSMEWLEAARVYSETALCLIDRALDQGVGWDNAHPALFMCRHSLELYLKAMNPNRDSLPRRSGHDLTELIDQLKRDLEEKHYQEDVDYLCSFLREFSEFDPKAMVFRFPDGGRRSFKGVSRDYEIWIDFGDLRTAIGSIFSALDRLVLYRSTKSFPS